MTISNLSVEPNQKGIKKTSMGGMWFLKTAGIFTALMMLVCCSGPVWAESADQAEILVIKIDPVHEPSSDFKTFLSDHASFRLDLLSYAIVRSPVDDSILNAGNWLGISTRQAVLDVRPDVALDLDRWYFSVKPRWSLVYQKWTKGFQAGRSDTSDEFFVNEWLARMRVTDELFISYGRENLQWGPAFLISPSNPFIKNNGRDNPKTEVGGLGYARLLWIPHAQWSASLIANQDDGAHTFFSGFSKKYAVKIDYTGFEKYGSVIFSHEESGHDFIGFFAGWSVSDAMLAYGETGVKINDPDQSDNRDLDYLLGVSYTFEAGPTLACEYFYNENGKTGPIYQAFISKDPASPDDVLIRKNYAMLQVSDFRVKETFSYVVRWILDLDDDSNRLIGILEYELGDRWKIFGIGDIFNGGRNDEFGSLNKYSIYAGVQWSY
jgi:hypothetical protein